MGSDFFLFLWLFVENDVRAVFDMDNICRLQCFMVENHVER